jgi:hypothetical protein
MTLAERIACRLGEAIKDRAAQVEALASAVVKTERERDAYLSHLTASQAELARARDELEKMKAAFGELPSGVTVEVSGQGAEDPAQIPLPLATPSEWLQVAIAAGSTDAAATAAKVQMKPPNR